MLTVELMIRVIRCQDYPEDTHTVIETHLKTVYTVTGYYGEDGLEWLIEYRGLRSTVLLELALSEYILSVNSYSNSEEYTVPSIIW
jgi:hypothetical protein